MIVKVKRRNAYHRTGMENIPIYDVYELEGINTTVTKMRYLHSLAGTEKGSFGKGEYMKGNRGE